ncbi:MAG: hypothetical protein JXR05_04275 [Flavobacteriaceae bacterium]
MKKTFLSNRLNNIKYMLYSILMCVIAFTIHSCLTVNAETKPYEKIGVNYLETDFFGNSPYNVPHDVDKPGDSTQLALSVFAWKEFIALNWPSTYNAEKGVYNRATPYTGKDALSKFLKPDAKGKLVWHTYKHRVEMYPKNIDNYNKQFDSPPKYMYDGNIKGLSSNKPFDQVTVFNNLDETSEINLCTLFVEGDPNSPGANDFNNPGIASGLPGAPRRMIYEAKANRVMFDYVVKTGLYDSIIRKAWMQTTDYNIKNKGLGATYLKNPPAGMIVFPFGEIGGSEGSIEVKATWRQLTLNEYKSGRYLTAPIIYYRGGTLASPNPNGQAYYEIVDGEPTYDKKGKLKTLPYGLVGLHIIHKTKNFPSYVFTTFEQVDNLSTKEESLNKLFYYNRNENPFISSGKQSVYTRSNPILADTDKVNNLAHAQIKKNDPNSVWQYYKLIGVQGHPVQNDNTTDYYLSNIATETNAVLANFSGTLDTQRGTKDPTGINVYQRRNKIVQGGCKGCHGNAQMADFSFITKNAPIKEVDFINQPLLIKNQK